MKLSCIPAFLILLLLLLLTSCVGYNERLKLRMALEDYYDSQLEFARIYSGQIEEFNRYQKP